tara:strand:+ start:669 stop:3068 length:2400 start_codon:yes stop_codon:yes gene_type:complete
MSNDSIQKIKKAQSSLKLERKTVSHVQEAMTKAKEITQFVKTALNKENRWIFQAGEQESIVHMLNEINKTNKDLYEKCRTPEHFNRDIGHFLKMKNEIIRKTNCIHFSLDQGFYCTEPLGFSPRNAVMLSSKKIKNIKEGLHQGKWLLSPIEIMADDHSKKEVEKIYNESAPIEEKILNNKNFESFDPPLTIDEIQALYKYFHLVNSILELERTAIVNSLTKKTVSNPLNQDEILEKLSVLGEKISKVKFPSTNILPDWNLELLKISKTDIQLRMHLLRIPYEPNVSQKKLLQKLKTQKKLLGIEKSINEFHKNITQELEHIQLFIDIFGDINKTFIEVTGILQNLSISFGKIYHNASSKNITSEFLIKVLKLIKGMLEKGGEVAKSKTQKLNELQKKVKEVQLFDQPIIEGILYAIELLDDAKNEMSRFCEQINYFLESISNKPDWEAMGIYKVLKKAYDESSNLTSAAMIFDSVTKTCVLLNDSMSDVKSIFKELLNLKDKENESESLYKKTLFILESERGLTDEVTKNSEEKIEELNWLLDEMIDGNLKEELRFVEELQNELRPVITRIEKNKLKESTKKLAIQKEDPNFKQKNIVNKKTHDKNRKSSKPSQKPTVAKKSVYDPFEPFEMVAIKNACKNMTSSEGKMIYHVLTHTHTFFTLLNKMESTFKEGEGLENELVQDIEKSKTTHDFLNNFARLKFLPHGYYNNNNSKFQYNKEKRRFEVPAGIEKQLKLSETSTSTPMEVYRRLIRVLLGFDESKTLSTIMPQQVLSILEEDFMLKAKDRRLVEEKLQST